MARPARTRLAVLLAFAAVAVGVPLAVPAVAAGVPAIGTPGPAVVTEAQDWASTALGDPWDFNRPDDITTQGRATIAGGLLSYAPTGSVQPDLLWSMASSQPWGRDGRLNPIDADRYTRLTLRLWSDRRSAGGVSWARCSWAETACRGFRSFMMEPGWRTYTLVLQGAGLSSAPAPWAGTVVGLRLTGADGPQVRVDWARLHGADSATTSVPWQDPSPGRAATVYWDADADRTNNVADNPGWGVVTTTGRSQARNTAVFPAGTYLPGSYRFYVIAGSDTSSYSAPLTVVPRPRLQVLSPSFSAGADLATTVRRDAWDMAQASDVRLSGATLTGMNGRWFAARSTNNDPQVRLPLTAAFSGSTYHRLTVKMALLGGWSLSGGPGGGCVGRLLWTTAAGGPTNWQTTDDLVVFPGWNTVSIELATSPSSAIVDPVLGARRIGWAGQTITAVRFDPHEDPAARTFYVDDVRLSADAAPVAGRVEIRFQDASGQPGTTATVQAVSPAGSVVTVASGVPVAPGVNTVGWVPPRSLAAGSYRLKVVLVGPGGDVAAWGPSPVRLPGA